MSRLPPPRVLSISPPQPGAWLAGAPALLAAGVDALLLRSAQVERRQVESLLVRLPPGRLSLHLRVPEAADLAGALGLGLHLPAHVDPAPYRLAVGGLLGQSCHDTAELDRAAAAGCDYALLSPVFPPGSKPDDTRPTLGLAGLAALVEHAAAIELPVLALGGIDADRAAGCVAAGAAGVAGISCFLHRGCIDVARTRSLVRAVTSSAPRGSR